MLRRLLILGVLLVACASARAVPSDAPSLVPPSVERQTDAVYPVSEATRAGEVEVELLVSLDVEGGVTSVVVATSGGAAFDDAAIAAVRQWKFRPARRGAQAIASRIKVPFHFAPSATPSPSPTPSPTPTPTPTPSPTPTPTPTLTPTPNPTPTPDPAPAASPDEKTIEVRVRGNKRPPPRAISDFVRDQAALSIAPHQSASDLLATAPGVYVSRPEGEAVAHEIFLRGFDAAHGQDMELTLGSVPLNQPSHIHGQGYGDLNFIIPETVRSLRVTEGVYDPRQGDFAVAGSIDFDLGVKERGIRISTSGGSFRTVRQLVLWAPPNQAEETFAAFQLRSTAGFGESRGALSASAIGQYRFNLPNNTYGTVQLVAAGARGNLAGVVRRDDIAQKRVGFYDAYPNPSATSQSAFALRTHAVAQFTHDANDGGKTDWALWLSFSQYRSRENYTGFLERSQQNPDWIGRGDLIEQENRDIGIGGELEYKTRRFAPTSKIDGHFALGMKLRTHFIDQAQALLQAPQNETWDRRVDASVRQADIGLYADLDWRFTRYFRVRGGARVDVLYFDIDDRLGNFIPRFGQQTHLVGYRRNALGVAAGPRLTLEGSPREWLQIVAAYGEGFRSPQARLLEEGENAPFAKVRSVEGGLRVRLPQRFGGGDRMTAHVAAFATFLQKDLAFDPGEGRLEVIGPTSRKGVALSIDSRPLSWLTANVSLTYVHATLDQPPPATAAVPVPPYRKGQLLPYVPPIVFRADIGVERKLGRIYGQVVDGKLGVGLSALGARPLPYGESSPPIALLDVRASVRWWFMELGVDLMNIANLKYAASEYAFVSDWGTSQNPSYLPARHITAGAPFTAMGTLTLHFGGDR